MNVKRRKQISRGFTLLEVMMAIAIFTIFALGVYEGVRYIYKIVYISRVKILETAILAEELETARNLPYEDVGISGGIPNGVLAHLKSVTRNGIEFDILTTVRNIDDSFDGMATGTAQKDTSPADYKIVEVSAICTGCTQKEPIVLNTIVAPKNQEGATNNGSLFVNVFDSTGAPVQGANVHIYNPSTTPAISFDDVTDNDGWLRVFDVPTGTVNYYITVTKSGYSSDYTVTSSASVPSPVKPPATVTSQNVTEIYFAIDSIGSLVVHTITPSCGVSSAKTVYIRGEKKIGREPDVYKYDTSLVTDSTGDYTIGSAEWDKYWLSTTGTSWSIGGTIPMLPVDLVAGAAQEVSLVVQPYSAYRLLVNIMDAGTKLPLSDASVRLYKTGYDETLVTGLGYSRQTDWSGGGGQDAYADETKYYADDSGLEIDDEAGDLKLLQVGSNYLSSGYLESSTFDLGSLVNFQNIVFEPLNQPEETGAEPVRFQIATSNSSTPSSWTFLGPDGTASTYYTATNTMIYSGHDEERYLRYKVSLSTDDTDYTPILSEVSITYTNACIPPGQSYFDGLINDEYTYEISRSGYASASGTVDVGDSASLDVMMSAE